MVDPHGPPPAGAGSACCPKCKISVELVRLEFLDDHGMLKDAWKGADGKYEWRDVGSLYHHPDWRKGGAKNPVSYSMVKSLDSSVRDPVGRDKGKLPNREKMRIKIYLKVGGGTACPDRVLIRGRFTNSKGKRLTLFRSGWINLKPSKTLREIEMDCKYVLPKRIMRGWFEVAWVIRSSKKSTNKAFPRTRRFATTRNERLITFRPPILKGNKESGVTYRRMRRSVDWVGKVRDTDHRKIISNLFGKYNAYTLVTLKAEAGGLEIKYSNLDDDEKKELKRKPKLLERLAKMGWSKYFGAAGAWAAADPQLVRWGAECQAICRLVIGMLNQLGSDADVELLYAWADFSDPNTAVQKTRKDLDEDSKKAGRRIHAEPTGPDPSRGYVMVDAPVRVGKIYIPPMKKNPADKKEEARIPPGRDYRDSNSVGWNNFEAYARYRYKTLKGKKRERFYGGGVGEWRRNLVHVFEGIAEYESESITEWGQTVTGRRITGYYDYEKKKYM